MKLQLIPTSTPGSLVIRQGHVKKTEMVKVGTMGDV
jgi:hypothetical protein